MSWQATAQELWVPSGTVGNSGNQNVGIGIASPPAKLSVRGNLLLIDGSDNMFTEALYQDNLPSVGAGTFSHKISRWGGVFVWQIGSPNGYVDAMKLERNSASPNSSILRLDGEIKARTLRTTQNVWADYVFEPSFKLRPLSEVNSYIKIHKHLPDVPSEKEILENGLNLGEMQKIQMQKIEELTLYLLEQNKQIKALEEKIITLEKKTPKSIKQ